MANEDQIARKQLHAGERIVFIQRGGVMTAMMDPRTQQPHPIDEFGTGKGWLAATTDSRVIYGYFGTFGGAKLGGQFPFTEWKEDPRGVAFVNEDIGPEDLCIFIPKTIAPAALHAQLDSTLGATSADQKSEPSGVGRTGSTQPRSVDAPEDGPEESPMHARLRETPPRSTTTHLVGLAQSQYARAGEPESGFEASVTHRFFWEAEATTSAGWVAVANDTIYVSSEDKVFRIPIDRVRRIEESAVGELTFSTADREIKLEWSDDDERADSLREMVAAAATAGANQSDTRFDPSMTVRTAAREAERSPRRDADEGFLMNAALTAGIEDYDLNTLWGLRRTLDDEVVGLDDLTRLGESYGAGITTASSLEGTAKLRMAMYMVGNYMQSYRRDLLSQNGFSYVQEPVRAATMGLIANGSIPFSALEQVDAFERQHRHDMCTELGIEPPPR